MKKSEVIKAFKNWEQSREKNISDIEMLLRIRKDLQALKRMLFGLMKIDEMTSDHYSHLSIAYHELEKLARKIGDELEKGE